MIQQLIVIEGADGVGKKTQSDLLCVNLRLYFSEIGRRVAVLKISFPNYESDSSYFVKKFLSGNFPKSFIRNEAYAVSCAYALDRYLTWNSPIPSEIWEEFCYTYGNSSENHTNLDPQMIVSYRELFDHPERYGLTGCVIIADRYLQSNWMYQVSRIIVDNNKWLSKMGREDEMNVLNEFIRWSIDLEIHKFNLPGPILGYKAFYLSLSEEIAKRNRMKRYQNRPEMEDLLERDDLLQEKVRDLAEALCEQGYMDKIVCYDNSLMLDKDTIQESLLERVKLVLFPSEV